MMISGHTALTRVSRHVLIKKYLIRFFHIVPLIYMIDVCTLSNKCFWILNDDGDDNDGDDDYGIDD